jgi:protein SCO1/2
MSRRPSLYIRSPLVFFAFAFCLAAGPAVFPAQAQQAEPLGTISKPAPNFLKHAGISQNLDQQLPLDAQFLDSTGAHVTLGQYFGKRPVVFAMVYFRCRLLCPQVLNGMATALRHTGYTAGKQYDVVVASIDPQDTPADAMTEKQRFLGWLGDPGAASHVHFLTGAAAASSSMAQAAGFHYVRVPGPDGKMDQYAHSSVIMFATPEGRMSKYLSGVSYQPRDVRLALMTAGNHHIGSLGDLVLLYCCSYDSSTGAYTVSILRVLGLAAVGSILALSLLFFLLSRKSKKTPRPA